MGGEEKDRTRRERGRRAWEEGKCSDWGVWGSGAEGEVANREKKDDKKNVQRQTPKRCNI